MSWPLIAADTLSREIVACRPRHYHAFLFHTSTGDTLHNGDNHDGGKETNETRLARIPRSGWPTCDSYSCGEQSTNGVRVGA